MTRSIVLLLGLISLVRRLDAQDFIAAVPSQISFSAIVDGSLGSPFEAGISGTSAGVQFKFDHVELFGNTPPNFVVLSPSSGTIPTTIQVGLNESVIRKMTPGTYSLTLDFSTVDHSPPSHARLVVTLTLSAAPAPTIQAIVSTASYQPDISPGEMVSIFGTHLAQPSTSASYNEFGLYPTTLAQATATFNGIAAPLLYASTGQLNAIVPYELAGQKSVDVVVTRASGALSRSSIAFSMPLLDTSPGVFTATQDGRGQATILQYPDSSYNSADNPASPGTVITMFATGSGLWKEAPQDGSIFLRSIYPLISPIAPVSLTIGGKPAQVLYSGPLLYQVWGVLQVNAVVPDGVSSGPQPVVLSIGQNSNAGQKATIAMK